MQSKSLLIAIAAFAVTATGVSAYGGDMLSRAGLNGQQITAVEEARELRAAGKYTEARDRLVKAGITDDDLRSMHRAANEVRAAIREAVENKDYNAFKKAAANSPLGDIITSEEDFEQFCSAHELRRSGDWEEANDILNELGVPAKQFSGRNRQSFIDLSDEQREALRVAHQSNDRATIQAIFDEAGYEHKQHHGRW